MLAVWLYVVCFVDDDWLLLVVDVGCVFVGVWGLSLLRVLLFVVR